MTTAKKKPRNRQQSDETIKYLIQRAHDDDCIVEVPAHWKVTFGYINPSSRESRGYGGGGAHCVRMYEGEKLRAVLGNATGLRDLSIPLARKFEKESGESTWSQDSEGNFKSETAKQLEAGFVVEDDLEEVFD